MNDMLRELETHDRENSQENEAHKRGRKLSRQCALVLELLRQGKRLTTMNAPSHHIGDLRRRIKDLRDHNGIHVDEEWELDADGKTTRNKVWFINRKTDRPTKKQLQDWWLNYLNEFPETKLIQSELFKNKNETT